MQSKFIGLDICPTCSGPAVLEGDRYEYDVSESPDVPGQFCCFDFRCGDCHAEWTVEYRPVHYFTYDGDGGFNAEPKPLKRLA